MRYIVDSRFEFEPIRFECKQPIRRSLLLLSIKLPIKLTRLWLVQMCSLGGAPSFVLNDEVYSSHRQYGQYSYRQRNRLTEKYKYNRTDTIKTKTLHQQMQIANIFLFQSLCTEVFVSNLRDQILQQIQSWPMAYLECVKQGPRESEGGTGTEVPRWCPGAKV